MARYSGKKVDLTYKQFLQFTEVNSCHYCSKPVDWKPHGDTGYNLDRKNNSLGYSVENCVVCCGDCNKLKGDRFTYEEMLLLSPALKEIFIRKHKVSVLNKC
jgi:hypothetical protein